MILSLSDTSRRKNIKRPKLRLNNLSCIMLKQEKLLFKQLNAVNYRPMHVRESITPRKGIPRRGFRVSGTVFQSFLWNLDSGFQSLVGFRIPWAVFQIPKPRIPDFTNEKFTTFRISQAKISFVPETGYPYMGWKLQIKKWIVFLRSKLFTADKSGECGGWRNVPRTRRWDEKISPKPDRTKSKTKDWDGFNLIKTEIIYKE